LALPLRSICCAVCLMFGMTGGSLVARAGGGINDEPHDHNDDGPTYFGFIKDSRGVPIPAAKVTVKIKNGISYVLQADRLGVYKLRGLGKQVNPDDVTVSCAKDGYRQTRIFRRPLTRGKPVKSVETECRLESEKS
jgi:hypothetical protein